MRIVEAVVLGLTQGLTEFLPVSSSAHLRVVPELLGWRDPGAAFTAVVQLGTAVAVVLAFRQDLWSLTSVAWRGLRNREARHDPAWHLARWIVVGTTPIVVLGSVGADVVDGPFRNLTVVIVGLLVGSWWLGAALRRPSGSVAVDALGGRRAVLTGVAQAAALVPGISRSGATIGAGLRLGLTAADAARFSFLLSVPAIVLAGVFGLRDVGDGVAAFPTAVATGIAFVTGYASIRWLLALVGRGRLAGFVVYRLGLAVVVLVIATAG